MSINAINPLGRQHYLDWLRLGAFVILIAYHAGMYFVTWDWHVKSDQKSGLFEPLMYVVNPWRLALLFFIAGIALRFASLKEGANDRFARRIANLLVALTFGVLVVVAPQAYFELRANGEIETDPLGFYLQYLSLDQSFSIVAPTWNHLWFLAYLLSYTILLMALRVPLRFVADWVERLLSHVTGPLAPAFLLVLISLPFVGYAARLDPLFPTTHMLINDWATHAHAFTAMGLGFLLARAQSFWRLVDRMTVWGPVAALILAGALIYVYEHPSVFRFGFYDPALGMLRAFYAWTVILALLSLARRYLNWSNGGLRYFTHAILPFYILHQTVLVIIGYTLIGRSAPLWLEGLTMVVMTGLVCFAAYELVIRRSKIVSFLFGLGWSKETRSMTSAGKAPVT
jgi:hypothetical protein